jgi:hypothetical protein
MDLDPSNNPHNTLEISNSNNFIHTLYTVYQINTYSLRPGFKGIIYKSLSPRWYMIGGEIWIFILI